MAGKPRRNPVTDEQIIASYRQTFSAYKTAAALGISATTVDRVLLKYKEPRPGLEIYRQNATKFRGQEQEIMAMYETGATYAQLRERFDPDSDSDYALKQALKRAGAELRENPAPLIKDGELEQIKKLHASGLGQTAISLALNRSQSFISRVMRKHKIAGHKTSGSLHPRWKGGRYKDGGGYIRAWIPKADPMAVMAMSEGHVLEHRLVMARKLGRPLRRTETVHHIDGNRQNNALTNLQLRQGKHGKHTVLCCLDCGSKNIGHASLEN